MHTRIAAAGLVFGPLLFTVGDALRRLVEPAGTPTAAAITAAVGRHPGLWLTAALLSVVAVFGLVVGTVGLISTAHGRGARITVVGAVMVAVGAIASVGHAVAFYSPYALFDSAQTDDRSVTALDKASESYPMLIALIVLFIVGMMLGTIVVFVGLRRARRVPIWSLVASVVFVVCGGTGGVVAGLIGVVAALAAFVPAARSLLREAPDEAVSGVRPLAEAGAVARA